MSEEKRRYGFEEFDNGDDEWGFTVAPIGADGELDFSDERTVIVYEFKETAKRVRALFEMTEGVSTSALEKGEVVVVRVEDIADIILACDIAAKRAKEFSFPGREQRYKALAERLLQARDALSRLSQQGGG